MSVKMSEAWLQAEKTCFTVLLTELKGKENVSAFRGFVFEDRNCWGFISGGLAMGPIERYQGDTPVWCNFVINARFETIQQDRDKVLTLCGDFLAMLKEKNNLTEIGNVQYLHLADFPAEPAPVPIESGQVVWRGVIPLRLAFATETEYDAP